MAKKKITVESTVDDNKELVFDLMKEHGITTITVNFNGEGDSGQIEDIFLNHPLGDDQGVADQFFDEELEGVRISNGYRYGPNGPELCWKEGPCKVRALVESVCYSVLEKEYGGWENNDGAYGEFVFDGESRKVSLEMNTRYTEVSTENRVF
jgi:hypothetical protein